MVLLDNIQIVASNKHTFSIGKYVFKLIQQTIKKVNKKINLVFFLFFFFSDG
jgi:hypothetical protein